MTNDFGNITKILHRYQNANFPVEVVAQDIINDLATNSPVDSGEFKGGWSYKITRQDKKTVIDIFNNSHRETPINLAILLNYGHVARDGSWVRGSHFIKKVTSKQFKNLKNNIDKELTK